MLVILAAFWIPSLLTALQVFLSPSEAQRHISGFLNFVPPSVSQLGKVVIIGFIAVRIGGGVKRFGFDRIRPKYLLDGTLVFGCLLVAVYLGSLAVSPLRDFRGYSTGASVVPFKDPWSIVPYMVAGVFFEEVLYRGYLNTRLSDLGWSRTTIAWVTAALFSATHIYQGWGSLPTIFLLGYVLSEGFSQTKSLWPVYMAHLAYDLLIVFITSRR